MSYRLFATAAIAVLALQACAPQATQPTVATDPFDEGIAKTCSYSPAQPNPGAAIDATITMTNDGWCAYRASERRGSAYVLGLVLQRPEHGELQIRKWNGESRVEYTANPGFTGTDKFSVALRPHDGADATVRVAATVTRGEAAVAPPPAEPEKPTTTRRTTRKPVRRSTASH